MQSDIMSQKEVVEGNWKYTTARIYITPFQSKNDTPYLIRQFWKVSRKDLWLNGVENPQKMTYVLILEENIGVKWANKEVT